MNTHLKSILAALGFSYLFYDQSIGVNLFIIAVVCTLMLYIDNKDRKPPIAFTAAYIATAIAYFFIPTGFVLFVNLVAFATLVGKYISPQLSLYLASLTGLINTLGASLANLIDHTPVTEEKTKNKRTGIYILGGVIAAVFTLIFIAFYYQSNQVFADLIDKINLDFISIAWVVFTGFAYVFFYHFFNPFIPTDIEKMDNSVSDELSSPVVAFTANKIEKLRNEHTIGSMILGALNLLLIFYLITDVISIYTNTYTHASHYSNAVHRGIYALIASIVLATVLILTFFRGELNFYKKNKRLKILAYLWIALNVILVLFTSYKNYGYVAMMGLTYKRIGVFVYLLLTTIGLLTTYYKVAEIKNFMYLIRRNTAIGFIVLILSALVPWDYVITASHLSRPERMDLYYITHLGRNNKKQLYDFITNNPEALTDVERKRILNSYDSYITVQLKRNWQESTYQSIKVLNSQF